MSDPIEREFDDIDEGLERLLRAIHGLIHVVESLVKELRHLRRTAPPSAPWLAGAFTQGADMSTTTLTAVIPSTRQDGSNLDPTAIGSITFQKVPAGSAAGAAPTVLATNAAVSGAGLAPSSLQFADATAGVGDAYTCFVTDTAGNVGAVSNSFTNQAASQVAPPNAPTLTGQFAP